MFVPDKPITSKQQDFLRRSPFAVSLAEAMLSYNEADSLAVGLFGAWGSGKSSIINLITEYINNSGLMDKSKAPLLIPFNPWNFSTQNQMFYRFFNHFCVALKKSGGPFVDTIIEKLQKYQAFFLTADAQKGKTLHIDFHDIRNELDELFLKNNRKIIFIIDDIDRLDKIEIQQVFQLMKVIANFPKTVYLASFDKEVIIKALNQAGWGSGVEYLEKIIQVPFEIPMISQREVGEYLLKRIAELLKKIPPHRFDSTYWGDIYHAGLRNFFNSIRDVNRFINALKFSFDMVKRELNVVDFFVITSLQVFAFSVFSAIRDNKDLFTDFIEADSPALPREREKIEEVLSRSPEIPMVNLITLLSRVFPRIDTVFNDVTYETDEQSKWRQEGRVCAPEFFDTFFRLSVPEGKVSSGEIESYLTTTGDQEEFANMLLGIGDREKLSSFLLYLEDSAVIEIPGNHTENVLGTFMNIGDSFISPEGVEPDIITQIMGLDRLLLARIKEPEKRFEMLKKTMEESEKSLFTPVRQAYKIYLDPNEPWDDSIPIPPDKELLEPEQQLEIIDLACRKIEEWAESGKLLKHENFAYILTRWMLWRGSETVSKFVTKMIQSEFGLLELITGLTRKSLIPGFFDVSIERELLNSIYKLEKLTDLKGIKFRLITLARSRGYSRLPDYQRAAVKQFLLTMKEKEKRDKTKAHEFDDIVAKAKAAMEKLQMEEERTSCKLKKQEIPTAEVAENAGGEKGEEMKKEEEEGE